MLRHSRAANSLVSHQIWPKFKLILALIHVLITCKYQKDRIKTTKKQSRGHHSKTFWNMLKSRTKSLTSEITPDQWFEHFHGVFNPPNVHEEEINYNDPSDIADDYLDQRITESEVLRAIRTLKTGKSPGIDGLSIQFIKTSSQQFVPYLAELFNTFYDSGYFPPERATLVLAPIHKKGSKDDPNNYRGVSLLPEISKIFTSIINNRLKV